MGSKGLIAILLVVAVGAWFVADRTTKLAIARCTTQCPNSPKALKTIFQAGPFLLKTCSCGLPDAKAHGDEVAP